jgi:glycogen operon protein
VIRDCAWYGTDGNELSDQVWNEPWSKSIAVMLNGRTLNQTDDEGQKVIDDSFLIVINASDQGVEYTLPEPPYKNPWRQILDTENIDDPFSESTAAGDKVILGGRSVRLFSDSIEESAKTGAKQKPSRTL